MSLGNSRGFKAFIACVSALHCSYFVALVLRNIDTLDGYGISERIKSGLCGSTLTQNLVNSVYQCEKRSYAYDPLLDYRDVTFFADWDPNPVVLVATTKKEDGTEVKNMSDLALATRQLLHVCHKLEEKKPKVVDAHPRTELAALIDVCQTLVLNIERIGSLGVSSIWSYEAWDLSHILLSNAPFMKSVPLLSFAYQMMNESGSGNKNEVAYSIRQALSTFIKYLDEMRVKIEPQRVITSVDILSSANPMFFVAENAIPRYMPQRISGETDCVIRVFTTFPEAASMLVYAVQHKIALPPSIDVQDRSERLRFLGLLIADLQILTSASFDDLSKFTELVSKNGVEEHIDFPLGTFWESFVTTHSSRVYLKNVLRRVSRARISEKFHDTMQYNIIVAGRATTHLATDDGIYDASIHGQHKLINRSVVNMTQMSKFIKSDIDKNGYVTLQEFVASVLGSTKEARVFNDLLTESLRNETSMVYYDYVYLNGRANMIKKHLRKKLERINPKYNEILDNYLIVDVDGSGEISLEEYLEAPYITVK